MRVLKTLGWTLFIFSVTFAIYAVIVSIFYGNLNQVQNFNKLIDFMQSWFFVVTVTHYWGKVYKSYSQEDAR